MALKPLTGSFQHFEINRKIEEIKLILVVLAVIVNISIAGEMMWISGSSLRDRTGNYGEKGVADKDNIPGSRRCAVSWIDSANNLYFFGGLGYATSSSIGKPFIVLFLINFRKFKRPLEI